MRRDIMTTSYDDDKPVSGLGLKDYLEAIYEWKWIILASFLMFLGIASFFASQKDVYFLYVQRQRNRMH
jgi:uncharacterized protein involved in exopolysaccharide biosynthesis